MILESITLDSGLCVTLVDQTSHYFGGYYHVKVLVYCDIELKLAQFEDEAEYERAVDKMGTTARFEKVLEKMAVPESEVEAVRFLLTDSFHTTTKMYLSSSDFSHRFIRSEYLKRSKKPAQIRSQRA